MRGKKESRRFLTTTQAARLAHLSPSTLLRAIQSNKLKAFSTPGGHFRVDPDSLRSFIKDLEAEGGQEKKILVLTLPSKEHSRVIQEMKQHQGFSVKEDGVDAGPPGSRDPRPRAVLLIPQSGGKPGKGTLSIIEEIQRILN